MTPNPFSGLLHSRKFWLTILDIAISTTLYFTGKYIGAPIADDIKWLIGTYQPVFVLVIGAIAYEDKAKLEAASYDLATKATITVSEAK